MTTSSLVETCFPSSPSCRLGGNSSAARAALAAGQTDHMFGIPDGSQGNGYHKRGRKPGRRTDFMNDPEVIPKRQKALMRQPAE
ncbi:hypothetical protein Rleg_5281 (plasmid) [Rhizobium leguminosarum bv. trifolii WSM1325]|uniref:Uncharacterized protein n=1 Tax=Rhizobium leguminosarum bv. trifolii (strain WSM1325) TaxID=395491 RepID=C6B5X9_RHILS|nr:hypothetical protein Rleg_5281 [Rhizobium leguminosarum bv. trifolii WSM1325]